MVKLVSYVVPACLLPDYFEANPRHQGINYSFCNMKYTVRFQISPFVFFYILMMIIVPVDESSIMTIKNIVKVVSELFFLFLFIPFSRNTFSSMLSLKAK